MEQAILFSPAGGMHLGQYRACRQWGVLTQRILETNELDHYNEMDDCRSDLEEHPDNFRLILSKLA